MKDTGEKKYWVHKSEDEIYYYVLQDAGFDDRVDEIVCRTPSEQLAEKICDLLNQDHEARRAPKQLEVKAGDLGAEGVNKFAELIRAAVKSSVAEIRDDLIAQMKAPPWMKDEVDAQEISPAMPGKTGGRSPHDYSIHWCSAAGNIPSSVRFVKKGNADYFKALQGLNILSDGSREIVMAVGDPKSVFERVTSSQGYKSRSLHKRIDDAINRTCADILGSFEIETKGPADEPEFYVIDGIKYSAAYAKAYGMHPPAEEVPDPQEASASASGTKTKITHEKAYFSVDNSSDCVTDLPFEPIIFDEKRAAKEALIARLHDQIEIEHVIDETLRKNNFERTADGGLRNHALNLAIYDLQAELLRGDKGEPS